MTSQSLAEQGIRIQTTNRFLYYSVGTLVFAGLTAITAQFTVPIPFSPVPLSLQVIPAFLAGAILGPLAGLASMILYTLAGILGLPVFSFGRYGLVHLIGPTGGYIIGYAFGAGAVGFLLRFRSTYAWSLFSMSVGMFVLFFCGLLQLNFYTGFEWGKTLSLGFYPFILQDVAKIFVMAAIYQGIRKFKKIRT